MLLHQWIQSDQQGSTMPSGPSPTWSASRCTPPLHSSPTDSNSNEWGGHDLGAGQPLASSTSTKEHIADDAARFVRRPAPSQGVSAPSESALLNKNFCPSPLLSHAFALASALSSALASVLGAASVSARLSPCLSARPRKLTPTRNLTKSITHKEPHVCQIKSIYTTQTHTGGRPPITMPVDALTAAIAANAIVATPPTRISSDSEPCTPSSCA
jgi:hypothetical protein